MNYRKEEKKLYFVAEKPRVTNTAEVKKTAKL